MLAAYAAQADQAAFASASSVKSLIGGATSISDEKVSDQMREQGT